MTTTRTTRRWTTSSCRRRRRRLPRRPIKRLRPPNRPPLQFPRPLSSLLRKLPPPRQLRQRRERAIARLLAESPKPAPRWTSPWLPMKLVGKIFCWNLKVKNKKLKSRSNCFYNSQGKSYVKVDFSFEFSSSNSENHKFPVFNTKNLNNLYFFSLQRQVFCGCEQRAHDFQHRLRAACLDRCEVVDRAEHREDAEGQGGEEGAAGEGEEEGWAREAARPRQSQLPIPRHDQGLSGGRTIGPVRTLAVMQLAANVWTDP